MGRGPLTVAFSVHSFSNYFFIRDDNRVTGFVDRLMLHLDQFRIYYTKDRLVVFQAQSSFSQSIELEGTNSRFIFHQISDRTARTTPT